MLPSVLMLLDWAASGTAATVYAPVVHWHTIEGPSKKLRTLEGTTAQLHVLEGPSKKLRTLTGD